MHGAALALALVIGLPEPSTPGTRPALPGFRATVVPVDARSGSVAEAIAAINRRTGLALVASPGGDSGWADRRIAPMAGGSLPFWEAIDALCLAGGAHYSAGESATFGREFAIHDGYVPPPARVSDSGPFRVELASVHYQSEVYLGPGPGGSGQAPSGDDLLGSARQFYIQLTIAAEPQFAIAEGGPVRLIEAVDDRGQSLVPASDRLGFRRAVGYSGFSPAPMVRLRVDLGRPDHPGRRIERLRGTAPVLVATRRPGPLIVSLDGPAGPVHRNRELALAVLDYRPSRDDRPASLVLSMATPDRPARAEGEILAPPAGPPREQLEILDSRGRVLEWFPTSTRDLGDETRLTLTVRPGGEPASVRLHAIDRASVEVPFEFRDVPMP